VAFHAQQAAEKALKGALVLPYVAVPRTNDLDDLRNRLPDDWRAKASLEPQ
jgi:HEPN domain-containing protein